MLSRKFVDDVEKVSRSLMKMSRRCREDVVNNRESADMLKGKTKELAGI